MSVSEIIAKVYLYASGRIDSDSFHNWFLTVSLGDKSDAKASELSNEIEGLLAESSHSGWPEDQLREALAKAIRPF